MRDRLNRCVVVMLMDLLIESSGDLFVLVWEDSFLHDMSSDVLINTSFVFSIIGKEARNGRLCFLHCGCCGGVGCRAEEFLLVWLRCDDNENGVRTTRGAFNLIYLTIAHDVPFPNVSLAASS
jgi:hypothetical protein